MENILEVANLTKRFGPVKNGFTAVDNISFKVKEGEIVGLLGPNGAGKTTTIFMLLDLIAPTSGEIRMFGLCYDKSRSEILQQVNYSSTYVSMTERLTVRENLHVMAMLYQIKKPLDKIQTLGKKFGITDTFKTQMYKLSAGQKTRVSLCKAFLNDPKVLLLDEPTASLDPDIADFVRKEIQIARKNGMTILITSHNMAEVEEVCDRVLFINNGKIIAEDTPEGLAKKVRKVRVELLMIDGQKRTVQYAKKAGFTVNAINRKVVIEIDESDIAYLLAGIAELGVQYSQISIDKPTLDDYFVKMAGGKI
jgi:ABC-2 type transport system ATP-binding protein